MDTAQQAEDPELSAYIQVYGNKRAVLESLKSFRAHYPRAKISLISDGGESFAEFAQPFQLYYEHSPVNTLPSARLANPDCAREYLRRIYQHCQRARSLWVLILEEDVLTYRRVRKYPKVHSAGPRNNPFSRELNEYLNNKRLTSGVEYFYNLSGGGVFHRETFLLCYEQNHFDLNYAWLLDERLAATDALLSAFFLANNQDNVAWEEVSEKHIARQDLVIDRDAAFDHNDKRWYGQPFDASLLPRA
jgi:hypothetical protein